MQNSMQNTVIGPFLIIKNAEFNPNQPMVHPITFYNKI